MNQQSHFPVETPTMPPSSPTLTASNLTFFDSLASKYDIQPWQKHLSHRITTYIHQNLSFISIPKHSNDPTTTTTLLDYACGTGTISHALGPSVTTIRAIDLSPNMISRYNSLATKSSIPSIRNARALVGNILTDEDEVPPALELNGPDFYNFDIVAVGGGLHHFPDAAKAISRLAQRLRVGGVLVIFDFVEEEGGWEVPSGAEHTIHKHGFGEGEMRGMMEGSGLGGFGWREMEERLEIRVSEDRAIERKGFLARAEKM